MEHICCPEKVFKEIAWPLKIVAPIFFTVRIVNKHSITQVWATLNSDGMPNFLHIPE
jgi:hypothetical protein